MDQIANLYRQYFELTQDPNAAATLVLAHVQSAEAEANDSTKAMTVREAARRLNCSARSVYDLTNTGQLKHFRIGTGRGSLRITPRHLEEYQERRNNPQEDEMDPDFAALLR